MVINGKISLTLSQSNYQYLTILPKHFFLNISPDVKQNATVHYSKIDERIFFDPEHKLK